MGTSPERAVDLISGKPLTAYVASVTPAGEPHVAPTWYAYHGGTLEFFARGQLLENLRENPAVTVTVPTTGSGYGDWHITMYGEATLVEDEDEIIETARRLYPTYLDGGGENLPIHPDDVLVVVDARMSGSLSAD